MTWLALVSGLVKIVSGIVGYLGNRQLLDAGEAKGINLGLTKTLAQIDKARAARRAVDHSSDSVSVDPDNRD